MDSLSCDVLQVNTITRCYLFSMQMQPCTCHCENRNIEDVWKWYICTLILLLMSGLPEHCSYMRRLGLLCKLSIPIDSTAGSTELWSAVSRGCQKLRYWELNQS